MAMLTGLPKGPSFPSGRYVHTNPLRREFGLRLLTMTMPDPLRLLITRLWRRPMRYDGREAVQSIHRQHPDEAALMRAAPRALSWLTLTELEVSRRVLEAPMASISRATRNGLLISQGAYLRSLYVALAAQVGADGALLEFHRLLLAVG